MTSQILRSLCLVVLSASGLAAQPTTALVVSHPDGTRVPRSLITELSAVQIDGLPILSGHDAVETYRATVSREPATEYPDALDELVTVTNRAVLLVARRQTEQALPLLENAMHLIERAQETLSRDERGARQVLDACLVMSRLYLETDRARLAREHTVGCRRLVPDLTPLVRLHPPEVIDLVRAVDIRLARMPAIRVDSAPQGCAVLVNGRDLGTTPFEIRAPQGDYRLQVLCGPDGARRPSRVHELVLGTEPVSIEFDVALDAALVTADNIALNYPTGAEVAARAHQHAVTIGRQLQVATVLHATLQGDGGWRLDRVRTADGSVVASAWVTSTPSVAAAGHAVAAIREGRSVDATGSDVLPSSPWSPPYAGPVGEAAVSESEIGTAGREPIARSQTTFPRIAVGASLVVVGAGAFVAGVLFHRQTSDLGDALVGTNRLTEGYVGLLSSLDQSYRRSIALSSAAGLALSAGVPVLARRHSRVPWWSWVLGAAGLGISAVGVATSLGERGCLDDPCQRRRTPETLGVVLMTVGVPLVLLPFVQLARRVTGGDNASVVVAAYPGGIALYGVY